MGKVVKFFGVLVLLLLIAPTIHAEDFPALGAGTYLSGELASFVPEMPADVREERLARWRAALAAA